MSKSQLIFAKLDPGFFSNRKVRRTSRNGRDVYLFALCQNAARGAKGWVPIGDLDPDYVADMLRVTPDEAQQGVTDACYAKLLTIDGDRVLIGGWDQDWARRPLTNAERQDNFRKRNAAGVTNNEKVTRNGSEERRGEERESARYAPDSLSGSSGSTKPISKAAATQPLSSTWQPAPETVAVVQSLGVDYTHELAQFRLNAAARGHLFADPDAAFQKFARGSRDIGKTPKSKPKPGATTRTPKPIRTRGEDGTLLEDDADGNPRPVKVGDGSQSAQNSEATANRSKHGET